MTAQTFYASSSNNAERTIAAARVLLTISGLFAIWLDPAEPVRYVQVAYALHTVYVIYAIGLVALTWKQPTDRSRLPIVTHAVDIVVFSIFQYLTLGPSSPFFVYFIFSEFCGAIRWGWKGTLTTGAAVLVTFVTMGASMSRTFGSTEFELNRFVIRTVYLAVTAGLLVYLGRYEERLRYNIESLARWPATVGTDTDRFIGQVVAHAAEILGAGRALAVWETSDEPRVHTALWSRDGFSFALHPPGEFSPLVSEAFRDATFLNRSWPPNGPTVLASDTHPAADVSINPRLTPLLAGEGLASAQLATERVSGRVFFTDIGALSAELVPLTEVVARQIGASLDQLHATEQLKAIAASEERIRLARDLHDGVLQSLTGIRLEIRAVSGALNGDAARTRERLTAVERALAIEQRELRFFINGLGPAPSGDDVGGETLTGRLQNLRERLALEWKTPVTIRIAKGQTPLPERIEQAVPFMVHEAIVNALKHAEPSRVSVSVDGGPSELRIIVADDGHGFPFKGRYDHTALAESDAAPRSLLDRVSSLGGRMSVESSDTGSRVEMRLALSS